MTADERIERLVRTIITHLDLPVPVRLWNATVLGDTSDFSVDTTMHVALASPDAVRAIDRKPAINTLVELWSSKQLDIVNGTVFDIAAIDKRTGLKAKIKTLPKRAIAQDLPALWFSKSDHPIDTGLAGKNAHVSGSSQEAIEHHYDVSNAFYQVFLDEAMVYTCAYFTDWNNSLDQAQFDKLDHVCKKLRLQPGDRLLDIGCGWGAMLIHAAKHYGVTGVGVSLSTEQTMLARERIAAAGLSDKITIEIKSYTEIDDSFDKISSIGMFEAVGIANYDTYFSAINRLLKPGGIYLHHAITRRNKKGKRFRRKSAEHKALVKYIFPGGELDHIGMTLANLEAHGMEVHDVENLREHYGRTCRLWAQRLWARFDEAVAEVGEARARLWYFYMAGCAIAFERGTVQINQTVATKRKRGLSVLPQTRADLYS
ncbi:MAG: cyclopropane-fatty-acyl-phospholipid synthase family protein [Ahrensia sp.]